MVRVRVCVHESNNSPEAFFPLLEAFSLFAVTSAWTVQSVLLGMSGGGEGNALLYTMKE